MAKTEPNQYQFAVIYGDKVGQIDEVWIRPFAGFPPPVGAPVILWEDGPTLDTYRCWWRWDGPVMVELQTVRVDPAEVPLPAAEVWHRHNRAVFSDDDWPWHDDLKAAGWRRG
jgi:hypothetical protein